MKQTTRLVLIALAAATLAAGIGRALASPASEVPRFALGVRAHINGQFESATGVPVYLGTYDATTVSKTQSQATTAFANTGNFLCGKVLLLQNAGAVDIRIHPVTSSTGTVSNSRGAGFGPTIGPGERVILYTDSTYCFIAVIATSTTANVDVWELN